MPEPCRSCDQRTQDFGGCRCQALLLTGNASATDPACSLAPAHHIVEAALADANSSTAVSQPVSAASFVRLQQRAQNLWDYRANPA
jgi:pyrroloquinoline quinone biosynthesis protein E